MTQLHRKPRHQDSDGRQRNILAAAASGVAQFITASGADAESVFVAAGVDERDLGNPKVALDLGDYVSMFELASQATGNGNFGLDFGQKYRPEMLGLIGEIAIAAPTLGAAVDHLARLFPFHQQATETRMSRDESGLLRLEYRILDGSIVLRRQDAELTMGMFANVFRHCLGHDWTPDEVHFEHPRPEQWQQHEQAFDAQVHFGQRTNALIFRDRFLDRRMPRGDMARLDRLQGELRKVAPSCGTPTFWDRVRGEIRSRLPDGYPHVEDVAQALGLARWTFQRRLAETGHSFSDAVEAVRRDLAGLYLGQLHVPLADIAQLLGYSEPSAFNRAFARWHGVPPGKARGARLPPAGTV